MFKVIGSLTIEFESDGEKVEQTVSALNFSLEEYDRRNLKVLPIVKTKNELN